MDLYVYEEVSTLTSRPPRLLVVFSCVVLTSRLVTLLDLLVRTPCKLGHMQQVTTQKHLR